jgi:hypothetical protein
VGSSFVIIVSSTKYLLKEERRLAGLFLQDKIALPDQVKSPLDLLYGSPVINGKEPHHKGHKVHQGVKKP